MTSEYQHIDADAEICADCAEIQAAVSDRRELDDDTAIDSSDVQADISTLAPPASRTPYKVHARCVRIWRPTGVWTQLTVGVCIGEKGSALMVHDGVCTLRLNTQFTEG